MTRIIGGTAGGRRIATPPGDATRPTSDRVREALFSAIEAWAGSWQGLRVLDLYAGSGAIGLEAWSRGAEEVVCVEHDRRAAGVIRENVAALRADTVTVLAQPVDAVLASPPARPVDLVVADPPYPLGADELAHTPSRLAGGGWLAPEAMVVVERAARRGSEPRWPEGLRGHRHKKYGETMLWYALWYGLAHLSDEEPV